MKDKGPEVFKLVKTNSALDFLKNNTSLATASEDIIYINPRHRVLTSTDFMVRISK